MLSFADLGFRFAGRFSRRCGWWDGEGRSKNEVKKTKSKAQAMSSVRISGTVSAASIVEITKDEATGPSRVLN